MAQDLDPSLERDKRKFRPQSGDQTKQQKKGQPAITPKKFSDGDMPLFEDIDPRQNQAKKNCSIDWASILNCSAKRGLAGVEPCWYESGPGNSKPNQRDPSDVTHLPP